MVTKGDVSDPSREAVIARVEIIPGGVVGWHTHPGDDIDVAGSTTQFRRGVHPQARVSTGRTP